MMLLLGGILLFFMCKCMNALQKEKNTENSEPTEVEHIDNETVRLHSFKLSFKQKKKLNGDQTDLY